MAPFKVKCYLQLIQCCQNKWMSKLEMTCFSGASRVTLSANFPHPVPCFCLLFVPATQLQRSVQPVWLSFMWLQLSCHGNSVSPMRQGFSAGKHFRLDTRWPVSARRMGGGTLLIKQDEVLLTGRWVSTLPFLQGDIIDCNVALDARSPDAF